ncbi:nucleoporin GLE1 [Orussus abietinus]|uniref:nucleoporin GLE1 n=1 Tax=Orussus abietinus TaxID=222816 RepID=UPI000625AF39|nr:nucleoporin GLE1 [Orussus abietinus]
MPHFVSTEKETAQNMNDMTSDFACLKVSILQKASRISDKVDQITIGPDSIACDENSIQTENIENELNSCNVDNSKKCYNSKSEAKVSTRSGITFSIKKILLENERHRKEEVRKAIDHRWKQMEESRRAMQKEMTILRSTMAKQRVQQEAEELARLEAEEERAAQQSEMRRKHEQQLHAQREVERKQKLEREAEEHRQKIKEREELIGKVTPLQLMFRTKCEDIGMLSNVCKDKKTASHVIAPHIVKLKELSHLMDLISKRACTGELTQADVDAAEAIVRHSETVLQLFELEIERIDAAYDAEIARREYEAKQAELQAEAEAKRNQNNVDVQDSAINYGTQFTDNQLPSEENKGTEKYDDPVCAPQESVSSVPQTHVVETPVTNVASEEDAKDILDNDSLQLCLTCGQFLKSHLASYQDLLKSDSSKKLLFEWRKAINIPVNAISGISGHHLTDKYDKLHQLLAGKGMSNNSQSVQGVAFCKDMLAKKIVNQGETLISSKPKMAFPIAAVAVALWNDYPDFGVLLLAHFHKTSPYTIPIFPARYEGQSDENYSRSLGYRDSENGDMETEDKYLKRMSGLMRLYVSIMVTRQRKGVTKDHPHGLRNAWRWLAATLNAVPRAELADVYATLMLDVLEVAGNALWSAYPKQFPKLLSLLTSQYYLHMQKSGAAGGPMSRLEAFLNNCISKGGIPPPEGQLPPNFW